MRTIKEIQKHQAEMRDTIDGAVFSIKDGFHFYEILRRFPMHKPTDFIPTVNRFLHHEKN